MNESADLPVSSLDEDAPPKRRKSRRERVVIKGKPFTYRGSEATREEDFFQIFLKAVKRSADTSVEEAIESFRENNPTTQKTDDELRQLYHKHCRRRAERDQRKHTMTTPENEFVQPRDRTPTPEQPETPLEFAGDATSVPSPSHRKDDHPAEDEGSDGDEVLKGPSNEMLNEEDSQIKALELGAECSPVVELGNAASPPPLTSTEVTSSGRFSAGGWGGPPQRRETTAWERVLQRRRDKVASLEGSRSSMRGVERESSVGNGSVSISREVPTPVRSTSPPIPSERKGRMRESSESRQSKSKKKDVAKTLEMQRMMSELVERTKDIQGRVAMLENAGPPPPLPPPPSHPLEAEGSAQSPKVDGSLVSLPSSTPGPSSVLPSIPAADYEILDLVRQDHRGRTHLHEAVERGNVEEALFLISRGCDLEVVMVDGFTPFLLACSLGNLRMVHLLGSKGAKLQAKSAIGMNAAALAAKGNYTSILEYLFYRNVPLDDRDIYQRTPLHHSVGETMSALQTLILFQVDVNPQDTINGYTPLHLAARRGLVGATRELLKAGASLSTVDYNGNTPLVLAALGEHRSTTHLLVQHCSADNGWSKLHESAIIGDTLEPLVMACDVEVDKRDVSGHSPLQLSTMSPDGTRMELLVAKGAKVNHTDGQGKTALHLCAARGQMAYCQVLVRSRANVNIEDGACLMPYHYAVLNGHKETAKYLLKVGAEPHMHARAEHLANLRRVQPGSQCEVITHAFHKNTALLASETFDLQQTDQYGRTALHVVALQGDSAALQRLLAIRTLGVHTAIEHTDDYGWNVLHWAVFRDELRLPSGRVVTTDPISPCQAPAIHRMHSEAKRNGMSECITMLLDEYKGVKDLREARAIDGRRPVDMAKDEGCPADIIELLQPPHQTPGQAAWRLWRWGLVLLAGMLLGVFVIPISAMYVLLSGNPLFAVMLSTIRVLADGAQSAVESCRGGALLTPAERHLKKRNIGCMALTCVCCALFLLLPMIVVFAHRTEAEEEYVELINRTEVTITLPAGVVVPRRLFIELANDTSPVLQGLEGRLWWNPFTSYNGLPVWERNRTILFRDSSGRWAMGHASEMKRGKERTWIRSTSPIASFNHFPDEVESWDGCVQMSETGCAHWTTMPQIRMCQLERVFFFEGGKSGKCLISMTLALTPQDDVEAPSPLSGTPAALDGSLGGGDSEHGRSQRNFALAGLLLVAVGLAVLVCRRSLQDTERGDLPTCYTPPKVDFSRVGNQAMVALTLLDPLVLAALPFVTDGNGSGLPLFMRSLVFDTVHPMTAALLAMSVALLWLCSAGTLCLCAAVGATDVWRRRVYVITPSTLCRIPSPLLHLFSHTLLTPVLLPVFGLYKCSYDRDQGPILVRDTSVTCYQGQHATLTALCTVVGIAYLLTAATVGIVVSRPRGGEVHIQWSTTLLAAEKAAYVACAGLAALLHEVKTACHIVYFFVVAVLIVFVGRLESSASPALPSLVQWRMLGYTFCEVALAVSAFLFSESKVVTGSLVLTASYLGGGLSGLVLYYHNRTRIITAEREEEFRRLLILGDKGEGPEMTDLLDEDTARGSASFPPPLPPIPPHSGARVPYQSHHQGDPLAGLGVVGHPPPSEPIQAHEEHSDTGTPITPALVTGTDVGARAGDGHTPPDGAMQEDPPQLEPDGWVMVALRNPASSVPAVI